MTRILPQNNAPCAQILGEKRLFLELYLLSPLAQFPSLEINLERAEADDRGWGIG
jgi:hypothetical protein